jgi:selenocysteine-specific elongation factor
MTEQHFILATAGHVDHGKSALVKALTGTDPDRLPEEKARGITIDLGFASLKIPPPPGAHVSSALFHLGIVDVPGHEDFVKNMVAGVGSIDVALFVVAADDGWMPQTEEHLQILSYLGVTRAVVALTKIDLAADEEAAVAGLRHHLRASAFADAPIVKTSVLSDRGIEELKSALAQVLSETPPPRDFGKPRLPVDRVFTLRGIGTVITGTLNGGQFHRGQSVIIQPSGRATRIRSAQSHNQDVGTVGPGTRTALNLPDVDNASRGHQTSSAEGIQRGDVVTLANLGAACNTIDVLLEKSPRLVDSQSRAARPLKDGTLVRIHHASADFQARVLLFDSDALRPGQRTLAQLRLRSLIFAFAGDHLIVRDWSEQCTLAGGIVLDADSNRKKFRDPVRRKFLEARAASPDDVDVFAASQLEHVRAIRPGALLVKSRFGSAAISRSVAKLLAEGRAIEAGEWVADAVWWKALGKKAAETIQAVHRAHPERKGLALNELRKKLENDLPDAGIFEALLVELCRNGFVQVGVAIRQQTHRPALPPQLQSAGTRLRAALSAKPLEPPSRKELAPDHLTQQALRFLLETGEAVELSPEVVLLGEHFNKATERIKAFLRQSGAATVSDLRQSLASSRRIIVPLLERLDRDGVTLRQGDKRVLRKPQ